MITYIPVYCRFGYLKVLFFTFINEKIILIGFVTIFMNKQHFWE